MYKLVMKRIVVYYGRMDMFVMNQIMILNGINYENYLCMLLKE